MENRTKAAAWGESVRTYLVGKYPEVSFSKFMNIDPFIDFRTIWADLVTGYDVGHTLGVDIAPEVVDSVLVHVADLIGVTLEVVKALADSAGYIARAGVSVKK